MLARKSTFVDRAITARVTRHGPRGAIKWSLRINETQAVRTLWFAWRDRMSEEDCRRHVLDYVEAREDALQINYWVREVPAVLLAAGEPREEL